MKIKAPLFCKATIIYILPNQNHKSGFYLKPDHSDESKNINIINEKNNKKANFQFMEKENFYEECEKIINISNFFNRKLYKEAFKKIYNDKECNFPINNTLLNNITVIYEKCHKKT